MTEKQRQRSIAKQRILEFCDKERAGDIIQRRFLASSEYADAGSIFVYLSMKNEVNTDIIVEQAFLDGKRVFVPVTGETEMLAVEITSKTRFDIGYFGIRTPVEYRLSEEAPDISVIPLLGFDDKGRRLGKGKGYYDRFLSKNPGMKRVAIAYSVQELSEGVAEEEHDEKMDIIITEEKIFCV